MGWQSLFPPMRRASDPIGSILPAIAAATGLDPATPVLCGIHDSNASLLPHLLFRKPPFAVISTGTWVIAMAIGGRPVDLDPERDTLMNVNAFGKPVPSARFMGGREFEMMVGDGARQWVESDFQAVLSRRILLLPAVQAGSGPFADRSATWVGSEPANGRRFLAVSFYLALMTATCLELTGAEGEIVVEGMFGENRAYLEMLAAATGRPVIRQAGNQAGTSIGAAMLANTASGPIVTQPHHNDDPGDLRLRSYAVAWRQATARQPI
jgi:sugar (pentulose or hexulose) kinase